MTLDEIERLRKLEKAATPRPWNPELVGEMFRWWRKSGMDSTGDFTTQDGEYAASVVNAAPALLDAAERSEHYREDLNKTRDELARVVAETNRRAEHYAALLAEVRAVRDQERVFEDTWPGQPERYEARIKVSDARKVTDAALAALEGGA